MPKVSVIVPVYNVAEYVEGCLNSLMAQTEKEIEIICVDDGSTDSSGQIVDETARKDKRIKVIHQKNGGLSAARNTGLDKATGEYVSFCDSDDYLHPEFFEKFIEIMNQTKADVVSGQLVPTHQKYPVAFEPLDEKKARLTVIDNPLETFLKKSIIATSACMRLYRRSAIKNLRFIEGIYFEDAPFSTILMNQIQKVVVTNYKIYYYYSNPQSIMRTSFNEAKIMSYVRLIRYLNAYMQKENPAYREEVRRYVLNRRFKMMVNQAVRKQKNIEKRKALFDLIQSETQKLYRENMISYDGLKLHHRVALFLLLHMKTSTPARWWMTLV